MDYSPITALASVSLVGLPCVLMLSEHLPCGAGRQLLFNKDKETVYCIKWYWRTINNDILSSSAGLYILELHLSPSGNRQMCTGRRDSRKHKGYLSGVLLTACSVSIRRTPEILTSTCRHESRWTVQRMGRVRVLDWFCWGMAKRSKNKDKVLKLEHGSIV